LLLNERGDLHLDAEQLDRSAAERSGQTLERIENFAKLTTVKNFFAELRRACVVTRFGGEQKQAFPAR